jgi:hypothetical protein
MKICALLRQGRFRCWASLPSSNARLSNSASALAYSGPSVKVSARAALAGGMSVCKTAAKFDVNPSSPSV